MNDYKKLTHTTWECKDHLIGVPIYRKKVLYGNLRPYFGELFKELELHKETGILEGHRMGAILWNFGQFTIQASGFAGG